MYKMTSIAVMVAMLGGCKTLMGPSAVCTPDTKVEIAEAEVAVKSTEDRKVIVLPVEIGFKDKAGDKLRSVLRNDLETKISHAGTDLVDRKIADKLQQEIRLAEQSGRYNTKGVPIADLAIITEIKSSDFNKSYSEASSFVNDDGERIYIPAKCNYKVDVRAVAKVVTLPDMTLVERVELSGDHSISTETRSSNCPFGTAEYSSMASKSISEAVEYNRSLEELLAPSAPILELRQCEEGSMVKIAIGANKNVQPGADVGFSRIMKVDGEVETFGVGEGFVIDVPHHGIKQKYSWVSIDEETALKVQKGDAARILPKGCKTLDLECHTQDLGLDLGKLGL
ncbi:hypothetical protein EGH82_22995 [Vibrio ponticus]|uniref:Uncharacterized protein n=1 Tax=Vibrio ponticus TaxID=265668 RepID=A0A3N3DSU6_9VIBR|nr:hypothetical protein [Vibrio ponticus]ROV57456.1 hypothetical protein EGH82_22995 [Vibrio ponticus]